MSDGFPSIDIILFAIAALVLFLKLRSVLGRRTEIDRKPGEGFVAPAQRAEGNVVQLRRPPAPAPLPADVDVDAEADGPLPLAQQVARLRQADPSFAEEPFLGGARAAFEMIVTLFAEGRLDEIRPYLAPSVMRGFEAAVAERRQRGRVAETRVERFDAVDLASAEIVAGVARVTVRFVTRQINVVRDAHGQVVEGHAEAAEELVDLWTFERPLRADDPNWILASTRVGA